MRESQAPILHAATATTSRLDNLARGHQQANTAFTVLAAISFSHLLNDTIQSLIPALYPILKASFALNFSQVGLMTLTLMLTASLLQPVVGLYTDRRPAPYSLVVGMAFLARRPAAAVGGGDVSAAARRRGAGRRRLVGVSSGVVADRANGLRRPARPRAVAVSGRRQRRVVVRSAAGGVPGRSARPVEHRVVLAAGPARDDRAVADRQLARRQRSEPAPAGSAAAPARRHAITHAVLAGGSAGRSRSWRR